MDEMRGNGIQHEVSVESGVPVDLTLTENVNESPNKLELKGLPGRIIRPVKFNSPIIHRRSKLDELLSIPDVAAALSNDSAETIAVQLRSKEQKTAPRPPSPAYLGPPLPESAAETPTDYFTFDFNDEKCEQTVNESVESQTTTTQTTDEASEKGSSQPSVDNRASVVSVVYEAIADSLGPFKSAHSGDGETTMVGRRLSTNSTVLMEMQEKENAQNSIIVDGEKIPVETPEEEEDGEEEEEENIFDTYNRPSIKQRRVDKERSIKNRNELSPSEGPTWRSLARAIARVQRTNSQGEEIDLSRIDPELTSILRDPGAKPGIRKKTVSFSRLPSEAPIKNAADCVNMMQMGHQFVKMRSNARIYNRYYWFDVSTSSLRWEPSKKDAGKARIEISSIKEVRPGKATELFLSSDISSHFPEECAFSIIYSDYKNLDLIAGSVDEANIWITGLRCLLSGQDPEELQTRRDTRDSWLSTVFESADANKDGYLDEEESLNLLKSLSDGIRETRIKQKLTEFLRFKDRDRTRLTKDEFVELFKDVTTRPEIYFLLARHASKDDRLSVDDLMLFLESEQGLSDVTREKCVELIERFESSLELKAIPAFGIDGFTKYLMSSECNIFNPYHSQVCQDMTQPLSHYYIASSHNTYLMEDQMSGPANVSAYMRALLRCCRCIELDCWDGPDGEPVICHGHTENAAVSFEQTIEAVRECGFNKSPYPIILCIENHCSIEQQKKMASILVSILGDQIYQTKPDENLEYLPSPDDLKYKILIRCKKLPPDEKEGDVSDEDEGAEVQEIEQTMPNQSSFSIGPGVIVSSPVYDSSFKPKIRMAKELSDLVSLCVSVRLTDKDFLFSHGKSRRYYELTSMHERTALNLAKLSPEEFVNFNKKFLTRVYPSARRVDSSNFNPQDFWNCGVQIASLNYQTPGLMMDINDGRFSLNGGCGYVLKPTIMRDEVAYFSSRQNEVIPSIAPKILHLRVISGQEFPKPRGSQAKGQIIDPYVLIELFGMPNDCVERRTRTSHDCGTGNSTALFDETFEFKLTVPDLALVRFVVLDDEFIGDEFIGQYTIPFECLQPGYRHLRLRSIFDEPLDDATLFVHIAVTEAVPQLSHALSAPLIQSQSNNSNMPSQSSSQNKKLNKRSSSSSVLTKKSKKDIQQQKARRERAAAMRTVGVKKIDDVFQSASIPLQNAGEMRENFHWSLALFKEVCGLSSLSSVKQCLRSLTQRVTAESQQGGGKRLSRKISTETATSYSNNGYTSQSTPKLKEKSNLAKANSLKGSLESIFTKFDSSGKLSLRMVINEDDCPSLEIYNMALLPPSSSDVWKKVLTGFSTLVNNAKYVIDNANSCQDQLSLIHKEALSYHEGLPSLLSEAKSSETEQPSQPALTAASRKLKKATKKIRGLKQPLSSDDFFKNSEWDFSWNCSVIRGHLDSLVSIEKEAHTVLSHLREAGASSGLLCEESLERSNSQKLKKSHSKLSTSSDGSRESSQDKNEDASSTTSDSSSQHSKHEDRNESPSDDVAVNKNLNNSSNHVDYSKRDAISNGNGKESIPGSSAKALTQNISPGRFSFSDGGTSDKLPLL